MFCKTKAIKKYLTNLTSMTISLAKSDWLLGSRERKTSTRIESTADDITWWNSLTENESEGLRKKTNDNLKSQVCEFIRLAESGGVIWWFIGQRTSSKTGNEPMEETMYDVDDDKIPLVGRRGWPNRDQGPNYMTSIPPKGPIKSAAGTHTHTHAHPSRALSLCVGDPFTHTKLPTAIQSKEGSKNVGSCATSTHGCLERIVCVISRHPIVSTLYTLRRQVTLKRLPLHG